MSLHFTLEYWMDDGWFVGRLMEVPGIFSQGESLDELQENIREAYKLMKNGSDIPDIGVETYRKDIEVFA